MTVIFDSEGKGRRRRAGPSVSWVTGTWAKRTESVAQSAGPVLVRKRSIKPARKGRPYIMESLILAQNERWRRVLSMQVGRQPG